MLIMFPLKKGKNVKNKDVMEIHTFPPKWATENEEIGLNSFRWRCCVQKTHFRDDVCALGV